MPDPIAPPAPAPAPPAAPVPPVAAVPPPAVPPVAPPSGAPAEPPSPPVVETPPVAPPAAPETYTLAIPDGAKGLIDAADLKAFEAQARAKGLTNDQAQAIVVEQAEALAARSAAYRTETEADPIYGGDKLAETQRLGNRALDFMAPKGDPLGDALRADLIKSGFGNKLSVVAALQRIGNAMAEDGHVAGSPGGGGAKRDPSDVLYDHVAAVAK